MSSLRGARTLLLAALLVPGGCGGDGGDAEPTGGARHLEVSSQRGPVSMQVRAEPAAITVGQRVALTLEVTAPEGVEVRMPRLEDTLGAFLVRAARTPPDIPEGGRRRFTHTYELDTFASGAVEIPAFSVGFTDRRAEIGGTGQAVEGELATDPLTITVGSVLTGNEQPTDFHDIRNPVDVPVASPLAARWPLGLAIVVVATAIAVIAIVIARRRRAAVPAPVVPPHEWAEARLERLAAEHLIEQGRFHEFYFRLTDIVRQYIERRFAIMAPERTTDEFLSETRRSAVLTDEHKDLLGGFLRAADMVKFARHRPTVEEAEVAFAAARRFVGETVPAEPDPGEMEAAA
ncbi:MAG: hypothetical protein ACYS1E_07560 [Planctomycetota bacterium]